MVGKLPNTCSNGMRASPKNANVPFASSSKTYDTSMAQTCQNTWTNSKESAVKWPTTIPLNPQQKNKNRLVFGFRYRENLRLRPFDLHGQAYRRRPNICKGVKVIHTPLLPTLPSLPSGGYRQRGKQDYIQQLYHLPKTPRQRYKEQRSFYTRSRMWRITKPSPLYLQPAALIPRPSSQRQRQSRPPTPQRQRQG